MGQYYKPTNLDTMEQLYSHDFDNGLKLMEHSYIGNNFMKVAERMLSPNGSWHRCRLVWAGDYMDKGLFLPAGCDGTVYDMGTEIKPDLSTLPEAGRYLINHTKKLCLDLTKEKGNGETWGDSTKPIIIHPLSLLTASGNGQGGGDFHSGKGFKLIGTWAGDIISLENMEMYEKMKPCNFVESN
jgi:hypothetical protein